MGLSSPNSCSLFEDLHRSVIRESESKSAKKRKRGSRWPEVGTEGCDFSAPRLVLCRLGPGRELAPLNEAPWGV